MIREYKLYHGAVLSELVQKLSRPVRIHELSEPGRLSSYVLDEKIGLYIKHSSQRLNPWPFTFTRPNLLEVSLLAELYSETFLVFVCHTDGMVCLTLGEAMQIFAVGGSEQAWVRIDRRKRQRYCVTGGLGELGSRKPQGLDPILRILDEGVDECTDTVVKRRQMPIRSQFSSASQGSNP
jgi:hypothetical protein